jgi:methionyl-tRNA synthetase
LKTILCPFLPFSSQKLHNFLGFNGKIEAAGWSIQSPLAGQKLPSPQPLFSKLDESIVDEEASHIGHEKSNEP